jgi:asparagine synthase (glutamine-hydrolysing)
MIQSPILTFNNGYLWLTENGISFKGFFYDLAGEYYHGRKAIRHFTTITNTFQLNEKLQSIHGSFTVLVNTRDGLLVAVDQMSMFPIYYTYFNNRWLVSDSAPSLADKTGQYKLNQHATQEFRASGFVLGRETLIYGIYRVKPGELILLSVHNDVSDKPDPTTFTWNYFLPETISNKTQPQLENELVSIIDRVAKKIHRSVEKQTLVVPLSGGYDSRLIVCMLKKAKIENVVCFTYGKPNPESVISNKVAEQLGYQWIFADYTKMDTKGYLHDPSFLAYCDYAGNLTSMPYLQEYFGVKYLKENKLIPDDSIFLPGHSGDYLGGSYVDISARTPCEHKDLPWHITEIYYPFLNLNKQDKLHVYNRLKTWFQAYKPPGYIAQPGYCPYVEDWDIKEKLAKFVFNSSSVFPYFDYEVRFPLWDAQLQNFFRELPFGLRSNKALYDKVLEDSYFKPMGVYFGQQELIPEKRPERTSLRRSGHKISKSVKKWMKAYTPFPVLERQIQKNDWICYQKFTREMVEQMKKDGHQAPKRFNRYNALICEWYIYMITRKGL